MSLPFALSPWLDWLGQGATNGPSIVQSGSKSASWYADTAGPIRQCHTNPVMPKHYVAARIARLLPACGPSAVVRFVVSVCIDAVQTVIGSGFRPHVSVERLETFAPLRAHDNSPTTVIGIPSVGSIVAAIFGVLPRLVFGRLIQAVDCHIGSGNLVSPAVTANTDAAPKTVALHISDGSAIAPAMPIDFAVPPRWTADNKPSKETSPNQTLCGWRHNALLQH